MQKSRQAVRTPHSCGARHRQKKGRHFSTVFHSQKEDNSGSEQPPNDKQSSPGKNKHGGDFLEKAEVLLELQSRMRSAEQKLSVRQLLAKECKAVADWVPL